jgi:hypothetical protein
MLAALSQEQECTMAHPRVDQLRFARSEWLRALNRVTEADGAKRLEPMNSIGWIVGHLAWQEHRYWLYRAQGTVLRPDLNALVGFGAPASTPSLSEMLATWRTVTEAADPYLDRITAEELLREPITRGKPLGTTIGSLMLRTTYHYWFHIGEILSIRQMLGHKRLPTFVGDIDTEAPYTPEPAATAAVGDS